MPHAPAQARAARLGLVMVALLGVVAAPVVAEEAPPVPWVLLGPRPTDASFDRTARREVRQAPALRPALVEALGSVGKREILGHGRLSRLLGRRYLERAFDCRGKARCLAKVLAPLAKQRVREVVVAEYSRRGTRRRFRFRVLDLESRSFVGEAEVVAVPQRDLRDADKWRRRLAGLAPAVEMDELVETAGERREAGETSGPAETAGVAQPSVVAPPLSPPLATAPPVPPAATPPAFAAPPATAPGDPEIWRLSRETPARVQTTVEHRSRFERVAGSIRPDSPEDSHALFLRTLLAVEAAFDIGRVVDSLAVRVELEDSRVFASDDRLPSSVTVNALEPLQAYVGVHRSGAFTPGGLFDARAGRLTIDLGSGRLVQREKDRNTLSAFSGVDVSWASAGGPRGRVVRGFAAMPVVRLPREGAGVVDGDFAFDRENTDAVFWGLHYQQPVLAPGVRVESYLLGLHERDGRFATSDRRIYMPGVRLIRKPAPGTIDGEIELIGQVGHSHATAGEMDVVDLAHRAYTGRAALGGTLDATASPRLALVYDYASGDRDPTDGENGRFDPLFGGKRRDFGSGGLYNALVRGNVNSPGIWADFELGRLDGFVQYRRLWLAQARDAWINAGLRDPAGGSGKLIGDNLEARLRAHIVPEILDFEIGGARLFPGPFARGVEGGSAVPTTFVYVDLTASI